MRFIDEYRDPELARKLAAEIGDLSRKPASFMEVCGSHTVAIHRSGLKDLLPDNIRLVSGPGCPVCVTSRSDVDRSLHLAGRPEVIFTTFGDMMRVPGTSSSLLEEKASGADVRIVYSPADSLGIAAANPSRKVVFFAAGFETTAPTVAATVLRARREGLSNFYIFPVHKLVPPAMRALLSMGEVALDGFICPGHVSVIIGSRAYGFVADEFGKAAVVCGFEPLDMLQGILMLIRQVEEGRSAVEIQYRRAVTPEGNARARELIDEVFEEADVWWRGIGPMPGSGLDLREDFREFDARRFITGDFSDDAGDLPGCSCGEVLKGVIEPEECPLFGNECIPDHPVGPCMVSSEGSCAAHFKYGRRA